MTQEGSSDERGAPRTHDRRTTQAPVAGARLRRPGGRPRKRGWESTFLEHYVDHGNKSRACLAAGVALITVARREQDDPAFYAAVLDAEEQIADSLEENAIRLAKDKNNVIANIFMLKAMRPAKYQDRLQVASISTNVNVFASPDEARALLNSMVSGLTGNTRQQLGSGRIVPGQERKALPAPE